MEKRYPPRGQRTARRILAENLRLIRVERHLAQEELADLVGLDRSYLGAVERGERNVCIDNIEKMAVALGLSVGRLLTETDTTPMAAHLLGEIRSHIKEVAGVYVVPR
jgi:transcriptional regulator with XRE-family HTH domain